MDTLRLVRCSVLLHLDELLGRTKTGASFIPPGKIAAPRRVYLSCCKLAPPIGAFWKCAQCGQPFDTFETQAVCPKCNARFAVTGCLDCRRAYAMSEWMAPALVTSAS